MPFGSELEEITLWKGKSLHSLTRFMQRNEIILQSTLNIVVSQCEPLFSCNDKTRN